MITPMFTMNLLCAVNYIKHIVIIILLMKILLIHYLP